MATKRTAKKTKIDISNFEDSTRHLESLIEILEDEETSLEQALEAFEEGVKITRNLQKSLQEAEQKVSLLLENNCGVEFTEFDPPGDNE